MAVNFHYADETASLTSPVLNTPAHGTTAGAAVSGSETVVHRLQFGYRGAVATVGDMQSGERLNNYPHDLPQHVTLLDESYLEEISAIEQASFPHPWSRELIASEFSKSVSFSPGIIAGDDLVAYSFSHIVAGELHLLNLAVHPEWRRSGIGKRLLGFILSAALQKGARFAFLEVRESNLAARGMYEQFGFRQVGVRKGYYVDNREDALVFARQLKPTDSVLFPQPLFCLTRFDASP